MRNAVIGLFPGQVLKDRERVEVEPGVLRLPQGPEEQLSLSWGTQLAAEARAELRPAWKCSGCSRYLVNGWNICTVFPPKGRQNR